MFSVSVSYFSHILGPWSIPVPSLIAIETPGMSVWYVTKCLMCHTVYKKKERKPDVKASREKTWLQAQQDERLYSTLLFPVFLWILLYFEVPQEYVLGYRVESRWLIWHHDAFEYPRKTLPILHSCLPTVLDVYMCTDEPSNCIYDWQTESELSP